MTKVAGYCRVSTDDQSLDRQLESIRDYAEREFDASLAELEIYRDKSTGTNTNRSGYQELMADAAAGAFEVVVVHSVSRLCRSARDLDRTASRLREAGIGLHIISEGLTLRPGEDDPYQHALFQLLGVFAELEANMAQARTREGIAARQQDEAYHHGRAPLGFSKDDGQLIESEAYDEVVAVLEMVQKGNLSKRKAAARLGCGRPTVDRALERRELYGL